MDKPEVTEEAQKPKEPAVAATEQKTPPKPAAPAAPAEPSLLAPSSSRPAPPADEPDSEIVVIDTTKGRIVIELYPSDAPQHVANFKKLVQQRFYEARASVFHRYEPGFVIQGGDPLGRDRQRAGTGGPGYTVPAEIKRKHVKGAVAAARLGDNVNPKRESSGSQFYICLDDLPALDGAYSVFGQVIGGMDSVEKLRVGDEIRRATLEPRSSHAQ
ncbi:peptidylprolyl isomerase [Candidatus Poribacteria bacterium]|nr:peptidylprolyl isomerase [Candidatus Poribacteria bacterium]